MESQASPVEQASKTEFKTDQVWTISGGHFIHDIYTAFVSPLLPQIVEKLSLSYTLAGSLPALMQLPGLINPFIGYLADKVSLRYFVILAPAATATLMSLMGLAPTYWSLAIIMILTGISIAAFHAPAPAMIGRISGKRVGTGMSIFMAGGELARTLGPLIAVWAVSLWGLEGMYRLMFLGWGTSLLLYWRLHEISGRAQQSGQLSDLAHQMAGFFLPLAIILFFRLFINVCMTTYLPIYMTMQGADLETAAIYLAWLEGAGVLGALLSGTISDRLGRKSVMLFAFSTSSLLTVLFLVIVLIFQVNDIWLIPLLVLMGFTALSTGPLFLAMVQDHLPDNRAVGNGLYLSISFALRSLAMVLVGAGADQWGLNAAFFGSAFISLLAIPVIFFIPKSVGESAK